MSLSWNLAVLPILILKRQVAVVTPVCHVKIEARMAGGTEKSAAGGPGGSNVLKSW